MALMTMFCCRIYKYSINTQKVEMAYKKVLTLVYLLDKENVLLGLKKRGFGEGKVGRRITQSFQLWNTSTLVIRKHFLDYTKHLMS